MHRIDHATAATAIPASGVAGEPGYFTAGNPSTGVAATVVTPDWANEVQEEIANAIEDAGIVLAKGTRNQLSLAIAAVVAAAVGGVGGVTVDWGTGVTGKPADFPPSAHTHAQYAPLAGATFTGDVAAPSFNSTSSRRYKRAIEDISEDEALEMLLEVRFVQYELIASGERKAGVIAEDFIGTRFGHLVQTSAGGDPESVDYQPLFAIASRAVQGLAKRLANIEAAIGAGPIQ